MRARSERLKLALDPISKARLTIAAKRAGLTSSEYVSQIVTQEVSRTGDADLLAEVHLEASLATAFAVQALLVQALGNDKRASEMLDRAHAKARAEAQKLLAAARAGK